MDVLALIISALALGLSVVSFFTDSSREKKEATLIAYEEIQNDVFSILMKYPKDMAPVEPKSDEWNRLTMCLAKLERFSVGINTDIYSLDVLNRLGGSYFIHQYEKLEPIILRKRQENFVPGGHYDEFEKTVNALRKMKGK